jgi:hypothetical protein
MTGPDKTPNKQNEKTGGDVPGDLPGQKKSNPVLLSVCCGIIVLGLVILFVGPKIGLFAGTCVQDTVPMTFTNMVPPSYATSFLYEFGEPEPAAAPVLPPMIDFPLRKDAIDALMAREHVNGSEESVVGLYEFPDSYLLLVNTGENVTEVLAKNDSVRAYTLVPRTVGSRGADGEGYYPYLTGNSSDNTNSTAISWWPAVAEITKPPIYNLSTGTTDTIQRIDLVLPGTANATCPLYLVNKTWTDTFYSPEGLEEFSVTTTGTFYVLYGQRVEHVTYDSAITHAYGWQVCSDRIGVTRNGPAWELRHTVKLSRSSERVLLAYLGVTGPFLQIPETMGSSMSQWISRDGAGCSC